MSFLLRPFQIIATYGQYALSGFIAPEVVAATSTVGHRYGWKPDLPDFRDLYHKFDALADSLPSAWNLKEHMPPIYDQGHLGSCTANAVGAAIQYDEIKQGMSSEVPSRLFIYYNERIFEHTVNQDSGASLRDGIKAITKYGYCNETEWPYDISKFSVKPPQSCYDLASHHKALEYRRVQQTLDDIRRVLHSGFPIVFGISVYESFESNKVSETGLVPMPQKREGLLGGHAIVLVSYDDEKKLFGFRNSWGQWGEGGSGYGYLPYDYVLNPDLAQDFWTVTKIN